MSARGKAHTLPRRGVIVVGGTGMVRPAVLALAGRGMTALVPARRPDRVRQGVGVVPEPGDVVPVRGDWARPDELRSGLAAAMDGRGLANRDLAGAILWVHSPHREPVTTAVCRLLPRGAPLVHIWGSASVHPRDVEAAERPETPGMRTRSVLLGYGRGPDGARWLTDEEISRAVLRAWDGEEESVAGVLDPWSARQ